MDRFVYCYFKSWKLDCRFRWYTEEKRYLNKNKEHQIGSQQEKYYFNMVRYENRIFLGNLSKKSPKPHTIDFEKPKGYHFYYQWWPQIYP